MRNIAMLLGYDGTNYCGWQKQKNAPTVQETLEKAIAAVVKAPVTVEGCGRTDAGVHAKTYLATFQTAGTVPAEKLPLALNSLLPDDIVVQKAWDCAEDFHGRFSVTKKTYVYRLYTDAVPDPFLKNYAYFYKMPLDLDAMQTAAKAFVGTHDFVGFMASGGTVSTTVRTIFDCTVTKAGREIRISVTGDGFLYNMVRILAGTLLYVGLGKIAAQQIPAIIAAKDRTLAGKTMPPQGLYLENIEYEREER